MLDSMSVYFMESERYSEEAGLLIPSGTFLEPFRSLVPTTVKILDTLPGQSLEDEKPSPLGLTLVIDHPDFILDHRVAIPEPGALRIAG